MKNHLLSFIFIATLSTSPIFGQIATRQAGLRMGYRSGIFYQLSHVAGNAEIAYNAMLGFNNYGVQATGLRIVYETSLSSISHDLYVGWGYGGHIGFIYADHLGYFGDNYSFQRRRFCPVFGADGWLAAEYRFQEMPLNISLNVKPFVEITVPAFVRVMPFDFAFSVSYVF
jgi:hypothetical protein